MLDCLIPVSGHWSHGALWWLLAAVMSEGGNQWGEPKVACVAHPTSDGDCAEILQTHMAIGKWADEICPPQGLLLVHAQLYPRMELWCVPVRCVRGQYISRPTYPALQVWLQLPHAGVNKHLHAVGRVSHHQTTVPSHWLAQKQGDVVVTVDPCQLKSRGPPLPTAFQCQGRRVPGEFRAPH